MLGLRSYRSAPSPRSGSQDFQNLQDDRMTCNDVLLGASVSELESKLVGKGLLTKERRVLKTSGLLYERKTMVLIGIDNDVC